LKKIAKIAPREFDDFEGLFERDFDDVEFEARDFEEDFYLD